MITISAVGDIMLGDHPVRIGQGVRSRQERAGAGGLFAGVAPAWQGSDVVFGNLEVVHSDLGLDRGRIESLEFRGAPSAVRVLREAGFTVLSVANNHCLQHGPRAFEESVGTLEHHGIFPLGARGADGRSVPFFHAAAGERLVLLGYSMRMEEHCPQEVLPYCQAGEEEILGEVESHAGGESVVAVSLHWGDEFVDHPSLGQIRFAHRLIDRGASIVLGHHPHVLQGVERYRGGLIAYSLGNFVFDMWQPSTRRTMVLKVCVEGGQVREHRVIPVRIGKDFQPELSEDWGPYNHVQEQLLGQIRRLDLPEAEQDVHEAEYRAAAGRKMRRHRFENYGFFAANLLSYRPAHVWQSIRRSFSRRRGELAAAIGAPKSSARS